MSLWHPNKLTRPDYSIIPTIDNTYELGSPSFRWAKTYSQIPINYYSSGSTVLYRDDTLISGTETSPTKVKEVYLSFIVPATTALTIYFELAGLKDPTTNVQDIGYARIYRNGSPYGTLRSVGSTIHQGFTETLAFQKGDYVQIYAYCEYEIGYSVRNFRILGSLVNQLVEGLGRIQSRTDEYAGFLFGTVGGTFDVNLYRYGADILKTDDALQVGSLAIGTTTVITSGRALQNITVNQSLPPASDNTFDLGSSTYGWRDIHIKRDVYLYNLPEVTPTE